MTLSLAVAGKGGTGKTTFSGLMLKYLLSRDMKPILAVDADANTNLNEVLALPIELTIGDIRNEILRDMGMIPSGMDKESYIEYRVQEALVETKDFDLVAMGKPEGTGCYCYVNDILKRYIEVLSKNYAYIVMDNEAGLEHISRGLTSSVDMLFVLTDPSPRGIITAARVAGMVDEMRLPIKRVALVLSRVMGEPHPTLLEKIEATGCEFAGVFPADELVTEFDLEGKSVLEFPDGAPAYQAVATILDKYVDATRGNMSGAA
jgi:CO dehydrogenase maturation factor